MRPRPIGRRRLVARSFELSPRDWRVLRSIRDHRFLTTGQLARLHFADHRSPSAGIRACVRVLTRLSERGLLLRLERAIGGLHAGSRAYVWTLDVVGDRLLRREAGEERPRQGRRFGDPSRTFLEHTLAVAEVRVELEEAARAGFVSVEAVETEPSAWRRYTDEFGRPAVLKPDLSAVTASVDFEDHWFIEVDRGTESLRTLLAKCVVYEAYRRTGREQEAAGVFPLVVWLIADERRRQRLGQEIARMRSLDAAVFRIVAPEDFVGLVTGTSPPFEGVPTSDQTHLTKGGNP